MSTGFINSKAFRLIWVVILVICAFVLGYTLQPRPSRERMMGGGQFQQRQAPPLPPSFFGQTR